MNALTHLVRWLGVLAAMLASISLYAQQSSDDVSRLDDLVRTDGSIDLPAGFSGAIDARGWRFGVAHDGAPRFFRSTSAVPADTSWDESFGRDAIVDPFGVVRTILVDGSDLYIGGSFTRIGSVKARNIARWDGSKWHPMGNGIDRAPNAMAMAGGSIYVGGNFRQAGEDTAYGIARWDGAEWHRVGGSDDSNGVGSFKQVESMVVMGDRMYVGGTFNSVAGVPARNVAVMNASTGEWSPLGDGVDHSVYALAASGNSIYAGGDFDTAGGSPASRIARWDRLSQKWSPLGEGVRAAGNYDVFVYCIAMHDGMVYVGGAFDTAGTIAANGLARWDSSAETWTAMSTPIADSAIVGRLAVFGPGDIYAITVTRDEELIHFHHWNGSIWSPLLANDTTAVMALATSGDDLYAGGLIRRIEDVEWVGVAKLSSGTWRSLASDLRRVPEGSEPIKAIAADDRYVYVAGSFSQIGGIPARNIAAWNIATRSWSALGEGVDGTVYAMAIGADGLYVGGSFDSAGAVAVSGIGHWDPVARTWSALGSEKMYGVVGEVRAIAVNGSKVYVGGSITQAGPLTTKGMAIWNAEEGEWQLEGEGYLQFFVTVTIEAIATRGNFVYMGGRFFATTGQRGTAVALWNGTELAAVGSGIDGDISSMTMTDSGLVIGGTFSMIDNIDAGNIALYDGSGWKELGSGLNGPVRALAARGVNVYAGGTFDTAGGIAAGSVAMWNGNRWEPLGSGTDGSVTAIAASSSGVYVGGSFTRAGERSVRSLARWTLLPTLSRVPSDDQAISDLSIHPNPAGNRATVRLSLGRATSMRATLVDPLGRHVATLVDEPMEAGAIERSVDLSGIGAGFYLLRINLDSSIEVLPIVIER